MKTSVLSALLFASLTFGAVIRKEEATKDSQADALLYTPAYIAVGVIVAGYDNEPGIADVETAAIVERRVSRPRPVPGQVRSETMLTHVTIIRARLPTTPSGL